MWYYRDMTTLLIDDLRHFLDERVAVIARNTAVALEFLENAPTLHFDEIWLDHDLGEIDGIPVDIMPIIDYLTERSFNDNPVDVDRITVHTSNPSGAKTMVTSLRHFGYNVRRVDAKDYFIVPTVQEEG